MTRAKIVETARLFTKARSQFVISDVQAAELAEQAGLDFSESTRGVWTHIEITTDGSSRTIELPDGYYRAESVFYRRGNNSYLSDPLAEAQLADLLDPVNDYYSDGYPRAFAVTKSDASPVLVLDTTPADGKLIIYYRGRLTWDPDPLTDASTPQILEEFHMGLVYRLAAYIAEIIEDAAKQASNLVLFEQKVNAYASMIGSRAGSGSIKPLQAESLRKGRRWGLTGNAAGSTTETNLGPSVQESLGTWYVATKSSGDFVAGDFTGARGEAGTGVGIEIPDWTGAARELGFARLTTLDDPDQVRIGASENQFHLFSEQADTVTIGGRELTVWSIGGISNVAGGKELKVYRGS